MLTKPTVELLTRDYETQGPALSRTTRERTRSFGIILGWAWRIHGPWIPSLPPPTRASQRRATNPSTDVVTGQIHRVNIISRYPTFLLGRRELVKREAKAEQGRAGHMRMAR